jgi:hypothetical protein
LEAALASLAAPGTDPDTIDPHATVGGLIEAFEKILDLGFVSGDA